MKVWCLLAALVVAYSATVPVDISQSSSTVDVSKLSRYNVLHISSPQEHFPFTAQSAKSPTDEYWAHPETSQFSFEFENQVVRVVLEKHTSLFSADYHETTLSYSGTRLVSSRRATRTQKDRACFYRGVVTVDGMRMERKVSVNTCLGGFMGSVHINDELVAFAPASLHFSPEDMEKHLFVAQSRAVFQAQVAHQPQLKDGSIVKMGSLHLVYKLSDYESQGLINFCGHTAGHTNSLSDQYENTVASLSAFAKQQSTDPSPRFKTQSSTQTVELCVVNDYSRLTQRGASTVTESVAIAADVSTLYHNCFLTMSPNVEVVLVSMYNFDRGDPYPFPPWADNPLEADVTVLLPSFHAWASGPSSNLTHHDNRMLFSGFDFKSTVLGYAGVGTMCFPSTSGGVDQTVLYPMAAMGSVVAHEMGHNFGMNHDNDGNSCPPTGYIMNSIVNTAAPPNNFSSCSYNYWSNNNMVNGVACLYDVPSIVFGNRICGNGFVESGEQCDCGVTDPTDANKCALFGDPCCDATNCQLLGSAVCSSAQGCCSNCQIVPLSANVTCRPQASVCDIAEMCTGTSGACPDDVIVGAGNPCNDPNYGAGQCYDGTCASLQRDCRIKGAAFTSPPPPYDACGDLDPSSGDGFCSSLQCQQHSGGNCLTFTSGGGSDAVPISTGDGVACGDGRQCLLGSCQLSSSFNPKYVWVVGEYEPCSSCDSPQTAPVYCYFNAPNFVSIHVADEVCSPSGKPSAVRPCRNDTLNLQCIFAPNDNSLDKWARNLAEKYGALDKAKAIRDAVPRWPGYPTQFSTTDPDYKKGVELMSIVPFIFAGIALVVWILWCACLKEKADAKAELSVPSGGYTKCQKWLPYVFALVCCLVMVIFACLGLFYNGELRRGCCESDTGANTKMNEIISDAISLANTLSGPLNYLNESAASVVSDAKSEMAEVLSDVSSGTGPVASPLNVIAAHYNGYSVVSGPFNSYPAATFHCTFCSDLSQKVSAINAELYPIQQALSAMTVAAANASSVLTLAQQRFYYTNDLNALSDAVTKVNEVRTKAMDEQDLVSEATDKADTADKIFHPFCIVFLSFVFVILLILVLGGLCFKKNAETTFGYSVQLNFCMLFGSMMLLAFAIPLMTVTGDSCEYLNQAEGDISGTLNVSITAARVLQSCLLATPMSDALNLTEALNLLGVLNFPDIPNAYFYTPTLDKLDANVTVLTPGTAFTDWAPNLVDLDCQQLTQITYAMDLTVVTRANVSTFNAAPYGSTAVDYQQAATAHLHLEAVFAQLVSDIRANVTLARQALSGLQNATISAAALYRSVAVGTNSQLSLTRNAANNLLSNNNCGGLGDDYHDFKTAWCDVMTTALSFLGLTFFVIGVFAIPTLILSRKLAWRLPVEGKIQPVSELEMADSHY